MRVLPVIAILICAVGCADLGPYVWVDSYASPPARNEYVIAPGDVVSVGMFGQETMTTHAKVRSDGRLSLPLLGDVEAAGYTPANLGEQLNVRYKDYIKVPAVTVSIDEAHPLTVSVAGEVARPGIVAAERGSTLLQVLLLAGGLTDFAHRDRIFVMRKATPPARIRFRWEPLLRDGPGSRFEMLSGDTVVVE